MALREHDDRRSGEEQQPEPPHPAPAAPDRPAGRVLALQRSAGNRAVAAMLGGAGATLARDPVDAGVPPVAGVPPNARMRYDEAITGRDWAGAATALGEMDAAERAEIVGRMTTVQLVRVARAVEDSGGSQELRDELAAKMAEPQHVANVPTAELEEDLDRALVASDWRACVVALHGLPAAVRTRRLEALTLEQLTDMRFGGLFLGAEYQPTRAAIEARRVVQLGIDYAAALAANEYARAVRLLNAYNDADLLAKVQALTPAQLPVMESVALAMSFVVGDRVYRTVRFVRNGPGAIPTHSPHYTVTSPGTEDHHASVGGGDVRVRTGVTVNLGTRAVDEGYEMEYTGPNSATTQWLQFIWREVQVEEDWWPDSTLDDTITTTGGSYQLTTDPTKPNYNTDSAPGSATPFYESGGANLRGPTTTTMFDRPSAMDHLVKREFDRGADRVTSRAHFSTYLVRDMQVLYRVDLTVQWVFERGTHYNETTKALSTPARTQTVDAARPATALDDRQRRRLVAQWPNYNYLP